MPRTQLTMGLSEIDGIEWIRLMYAYPSQFPDELIDVIAENPKVCKYIDIPLQHISDKILKSMRRGVSAKRTRELLLKLKSRIHGITIRTTFIVGYPNESDEDFRQLYDFVKEMEFDRIGTFTFSQEENTTSFLLGDPVAEKVKLKRKDSLMELQKEISLRLNKNLVGKKLQVLVEGKEGNYFIGRSYRDAPEVDGEVLIPANGVKLNPGEFYNVEVFDYNEYDLYGNISLNGS